MIIHTWELMVHKFTCNPMKCAVQRYICLELKPQNFQAFKMASVVQEDMKLQIIYN